MRHVVISILLAATPGASSAQIANDRDAVLQTVQTFFNTMTANDVEGAGKILMPLGRFHIMDMRKSTLEPRTFTGEEYLARMRKSKQTRRERIWDPEVRVHGLIASVWAPYDFWVDGKFSHCGVDLFDLIKTAERWKIAGGA
jgi:Putative lumazine-binding